MATEKPRYTITVDDDTFKKIENFRFENRYQSRSEATLELIRLGMETFEKVSQKTGLSEKEIFKLYQENPEKFIELLSTPA